MILTAPSRNIMNKLARCILTLYSYDENPDELTPETFDGAVWLMKVPKNLLILAEEIMDWQDKYGGVDSKAMSPFTSESFAGYSYSKSGGYSYGQNSTPQTGRQTAYATRLAPWRKL